MSTSGLLLINIKTPTERFSKNGEQKNLHLVVKKTAFTVVITPYPPIDVQRIAVDASLLYDCPDQKPVDYVKKSPMEYVAHADSTGSNFIVEMKILVLTSQLEDMFFRLRFEVYDPQLPRNPQSSLVSVSEPLKVLSKADQIQRKRRGGGAPDSRKRKLADKSLVESLTKLLKNQSHQTLLVRNLYEKEMFQSSRQASTSTPLPEPNEDFEEAFWGLMRAYESLPCDQRPATIRKLIRNSSNPDRDVVNDLLSKFQVEETKAATDGKCVHQRELESVEGYLKGLPCLNDLTCI